MSDQPTALRLALALEKSWAGEVGHDRERQAAAELRRLYDVLGKSQALNRIREARIKELEAQLEKKSDAIQRLWKERDQLRANRDELFGVLVQISELTDLGGEVADYQDVVEAVKRIAPAEREACAKAAEDMCDYGKPYSAAAAIRSRGEA